MKYRDAEKTHYFTTELNGKGWQQRIHFPVTVMSVYLTAVHLAIKEEARDTTETCRYPPGAQTPWIPWKVIIDMSRNYASPRWQPFIQLMQLYSANLTSKKIWFELSMLFKQCHHCDEEIPWEYSVFSLHKIVHIIVKSSYLSHKK